METTDFQNLSSLEEKALNVHNAIMSGDEIRKITVCDILEKAITFGGADLTKQQHYALLGDAFFYLLTTKEPNKLPYSLRSQMILYAAHYCTLRYVRDTEKGEIVKSPSNYIGALKRAYIISKIYNAFLTGEVYSFSREGLYMGDDLVNSLYCRLDSAEMKVTCDEITETLYFMQQLKQDTSVVYSYDVKKEMSVNAFIDKVLDRYKSYILWDTQDKIRDEIMF